MTVAVARWSTPFQFASNVQFSTPSVAAVGSQVGTTGTFVVVWSDFTDSLGLGEKRLTIRSARGQAFKDRGEPLKEATQRASSMLRRAGVGPELR